MEEKKPTNQDKIVLLCSFEQPDVAYKYEEVLKAAEIPCYIRNDITSRILGSFVPVGGARLEVFEYDIERAFKAIEESGLPIPDSDEEFQHYKLQRWVNHTGLFKNKPLETRITYILILLGIVLLLLAAISFLIINLPA